MKSRFSKAVYRKNAEIYKVLANPKRLEILNLLLKLELSVEELRSTLKLSKANMSQHLALLRHARLVRVRREGKRAFYRIIDPRIVEPCQILHDLWAQRKLT